MVDADKYRYFKVFLLLIMVFICFALKSQKKKKNLLNWESLLQENLKDPSHPRSEVFEIRHFRCHQNYENCIMRPNLIAVQQVVLLEVC